jgi:hypothetical protein
LPAADIPAAGPGSASCRTDRKCANVVGVAMTRPARVREPQIVAEQIAALRVECERTASRFHVGALDALRWLTEGGPGPLTGHLAEKPLMVRSLVRELAVAEGESYGRNRAKGRYAQGVLHALMWAQYATTAPPVPLQPPAARAARPPHYRHTG